MISVLLVLLSVAALAEGEKSTINQTVDGSISISGLMAGDKVSFYKVLGFDKDNVTYKGWAAETGFTDLTDEQMKAILGLEYNEGSKEWVQTMDRSAYGITPEIAGAIGIMAKSANVKYDSTTTPAVVISGSEDSKTATVTGAEAGLYIAIIHPGKAGVIYNPVIVGADYYTNNPGESSTWTVDENDTYYYIPANATGMSKRKTIELTKEATAVDGDADTVKVGDTVSFTVKTTIPEYADNYQNPVFNLTDVLTSGLVLTQDSIKVYAAETATGTPLAETSGDNKTYTIPTKSATGYKIVFDPKYINHVIWHCRCDCGNEKDVAAPRLTMGLATCCGCETSRLHDLTGRRFGRLLVIDRAENVYYPLVCLCGDGGAGKDRRVFIVVCRQVDEHKSLSIPRQET